MKKIRKGLESLLGKRFVNMKELREAMYQKDSSGKQLLPKNVYPSEGETVRADELPFAIKEWPIYCFHGYGLTGVSKVAKITVSFL